jgi:hypothetical protein
MGASGWNYFTPFREDVGEAFEALREDVFRRKEYGNSALKMKVSADQLAKLPPQLREAMETLMRMSEAEDFGAGAPGETEPDSIEELLEQCAEDGTHSILDVAGGISDGPEFGTAFPMPDAVKQDLYGTTRPTRPQVEAKMHERSDDLDRWQCWYVIVYDRQGRPSEIYFEGCSGD